MSTKKFWDWVNKERKARGLSFRAIERAGGLSNGAVSKRESEGLPPTPTSCLAIAKAFNVPVESTFERAGLLPPVPDEDTLNKEISRMLSLLTVEEQEMVIEMMRGLYERKIRRATTIPKPKTASQT